MTWRGEKCRNKDLMRVWLTGRDGADLGPDGREVP